MGQRRVALFATNQPDAELCLRNVRLQLPHRAVFHLKGLHTRRESRVR